MKKQQKQQFDWLQLTLGFPSSRISMLIENWSKYFNQVPCPIDGWVIQKYKMSYSEAHIICAFQIPKHCWLTGKTRLWRFYRRVAPGVTLFVSGQFWTPSLSNENVDEAYDCGQKWPNHGTRRESEKESNHSSTYLRPVFSVLLCVVAPVSKDLSLGKSPSALHVTSFELHVEIP